MTKSALCSTGKVLEQLQKTSN